MNLFGPMRSDDEIDAEEALKDAIDNLSRHGGTGYERDYREAASRYEAVTGRPASQVRGR